jgi:hypothetical protein
MCSLRSSPFGAFFAFFASAECISATQVRNVQSTAFAGSALEQLAQFHMM